MSESSPLLPLWYRRTRKVVRLRYRAWRERGAQEPEQPEAEPEAPIEPEQQPQPEPEPEMEEAAEIGTDAGTQPEPAAEPGPGPKAAAGDERLPLIYPNGMFDLGSFGRYTREESQAAIRSLCRYSHLGEGEGLTWVLGRYKMFVDPRDDSHSAQLILDGFWETWVTEVLVRLVRRGAIVADIGANLGYYSLLMADLVGSAGRVHCFEPNPFLAEKLLRSLELNGFRHWCRLHQFPLGAKDGEKVLFHASEREPKNGAIFPIPVPFDRELVPVGSRLMTTHRLDSWDEWHEIELAKIDAEGAEELIWDGAEGLLKGDRLHTIILEFTPERYADAGAFLDKILAAGFEPSLIDPGRGVVKTTRKKILAGKGGEDQMLLLRRGTALRRRLRDHVDGRTKPEPKSTKRNMPAKPPRQRR